MDIEALRIRIREGNYLVKSHAVRHAVKEGFERKNIVEAILDGKIIEEYSDRERVLVCGRTLLRENVVFNLHVVCEFTGPAYVEFITAYIPDRDEWLKPNFTRRKRKRKK